jgi:benzil reductase ((S)-benzoin forming)
MKTALITGGGSGIGRALALELAQNNIKAYIIGRTLEKLESVKKQSPKMIEFIVADVATNEGRQAIIDNFKEDKLDYLIHNAAITGPLKPLDKISEQEWQECVSINLNGPLFLTQKLLPVLHSGSRVLHISSGLAHRCMNGIAAYSCTKSALHMLYNAWNIEMADKNILFGSIRPGIVDTGMQDVLRKDNQEFPSQEVFKSFHEEGQLMSSEETAKKINLMLLDMDDESYISQEWDVRDEHFCKVSG